MRNYLFFIKIFSHNSKRKKKLSCRKTFFNFSPKSVNVSSIWHTAEADELMKNQLLTSNHILLINQSRKIAKKPWQRLFLQITLSVIVDARCHMRMTVKEKYSQTDSFHPNWDQFHQYFTRGFLGWTFLAQEYLLKCANKMLMKLTIGELIVIYQLEKNLQLGT